MKFDERWHGGGKNVSHIINSGLALQGWTGLGREAKWALIMQNTLIVSCGAMPREGHGQLGSV